MASTSGSTLGHHLRVRAAAEALGVSLSSFRRLAHEPGFPPLIRLSERCTVVSEEALAQYMRRKAQDAARANPTELA